MEPMNWWVGMKNPSLQLLVYGKDIAAYRPEISYPGVEIEKVVTTTNPNYQFIYLNIGKDTRPGEMDIVFKKVIKRHLPGNIRYWPGRKIQRPGKGSIIRMSFIC